MINGGRRYRAQMSPCCMSAGHGARGQAGQHGLGYTNTMPACCPRTHPASGTATGDSSALTIEGWPTSYQPAVKRPAATAKHRHRRQQDTPGDMLLQGCRGNLGE